MLEAELAKYQESDNRPSGFFSPHHYRPIESQPSAEAVAFGEQAAQLLVNEGFTDEDAAERVAIHLHAAIVATEDTSSVSEFSDTIMRDPFRNDGKPTSPNVAMSIAPFIPYIANYEVDMAELMKCVMAPDEDWERSFPAMRWLTLWQPEVDKHTFDEIMERLIETDEIIAFDAFALYAASLVEAYRGREQRLARLFASIPDRRYLPVLSQLGVHDTTPESLLPLLQDERVAADGRIRAVQHVDQYAGSCTKLDAYHIESLDRSGNEGDQGHLTFMKVGGIVVGSMKMRKDPSIASYVTVEDEEGRFPLVKGGAYVTTKAITDAAKDAYYEQGPWATLELDELPVRPIRFVSYEFENDISGVLSFIEMIDKVTADI